MIIKQFKLIYFRIPIIIKLLITIVFLMCFFGTVIHFIEPTQFPTIFEGIWWAFVTAATVGFGDYVPLTTSGKLIGILLILTGGGLIGFYVSSIASGTIKREQDIEHGRLAFKGTGHLILVGWNERTRQLIKIVLEKNPNEKIVLIDRTLRHISFSEYPIHFINGDATEDAILTKANIRQAERVLLTADLIKNERQADTYTILATVAIRGNNENIPIIAEILSKSQIENALRAGATTIIRSNDFMSALFYHELTHSLAVTPFEDILHILSKQQFSHFPVAPEFVDKQFAEVSHHLIKGDHLLIGIIREKKYNIHPPPDLLLEHGDILVTLVRL
ncbi:potassium channel protein [Oceanobacillus zhaokaii]|uniref:Potassium channel protein n=1 Tax=Oceanobacillus zhaokaii TaxID=2052660 RepID=A0A345PIL2_9BACI|nr:potassium channel family protein [Oceanobacillus zhaokaii]AXI09842.1 potassium channel protein [Oceanobacillus zhaokaii]